MRGAGREQVQCSSTVRVPAMDKGTHAQRLCVTAVLVLMQAVLMVDRMISPFTLMSGPVLFILSMAIVRSFAKWSDIITAICIYILWVLFSRTVRMLPHFYRCPGASSMRCSSRDCNFAWPEPVTALANCQDRSQCQMAAVPDW